MLQRPCDMEKQQGVSKVEKRHSWFLELLQEVLFSQADGSREGREKEFTVEKAGELSFSSTGVQLHMSTGGNGAWRV